RGGRWRGRTPGPKEDTQAAVDQARGDALVPSAGANPVAGLQQRRGRVVARLHPGGAPEHAEGELRDLPGAERALSRQELLPAERGKAVLLLGRARPAERDFRRHRDAFQGRHQGPGRGSPVPGQAPVQATPRPAAQVRRGIAPGARPAFANAALRSFAEDNDRRGLGTPLLGLLPQAAKRGYGERADYYGIRAHRHGQGRIEEADLRRGAPLPPARGGSASASPAAPLFSRRHRGPLRQHRRRGDSVVVDIDPAAGGAATTTALPPPPPRTTSTATTTATRPLVETPEGRKHRGLRQSSCRFLPGSPHQIRLHVRARCPGGRCRGREAPGRRHGRAVPRT
ncbi:unnamed protein product, partial [Scytosiphon promiscuus]